MMSWLRNIVEHLDYLRGRYTAFPVRDDRAGRQALRDG